MIREINPRSTECKADVVTTTSSRRLLFRGVLVIILGFRTKGVKKFYKSITGIRQERHTEVYVLGCSSIKYVSKASVWFCTYTESTRLSLRNRRKKDVKSNFLLELLFFTELPKGCTRYQGLNPTRCYVTLWKRVGCLREGYKHPSNWSQGLKDIVSQFNLE